ncbi:MAG: hydrogenase maturation nickel metallochaperone HypA [Syntrophales bacterium]|nr:hydrogenase maturation nickel metallochaperone HypA [Syntrophales bacterium]
MHELPITEGILKIVLKHAARNKANKVVLVRLRIGRLCDLEAEWIQNYFSYLSKGTVAEGAKIEIERVPAVVICRSCGQEYEMKNDGLISFLCPNCGSQEVEIVSGREYFVSEMEVY